MGPADLVLNGVGVLGVALVLLAYAGIHFDRLDPKRTPSLLMNLCGSSLIMLSMARAFNLPAFLIEAAWAGMAAFGLARRLLLRRRSSLLS